MALGGFIGYPCVRSIGKEKKKDLDFGSNYGVNFRDGNGSLN